MPMLPMARQSADADYNGERLVNYFLRPTQGVSKGALIGRSGALSVLDLGGAVRACIDFDGILYAVAAGKLWKVVGAVSTEVGSVGTSEAVSIATSGTEIALVVGTTYYVSDGVTVTSYSTGEVTTPRYVTYQDGYFIVAGENATRKDVITVSGLDDGTTFSGLDFATAESQSDEIRGIISDHGEIWLLGAKSIEVWYNSGNADFPFARNPGATTERGCLSNLTIAKEDNGVFWVGNDKIVYRSAGSSPKVISTREIEEALNANDIHSAMTFTERGHKFYAIRMVGAPTLVFDITTQLWHERTTATAYDPWFITCGAEVDGEQYFGTDTGKIVTLDKDTFTDDGATLSAEVITAPIVEADRFVIARLHVDVKGSGNHTQTPQIMMQTSSDGHTWSIEDWRDLAALGYYNWRAEWHGLGAFDRFQVRLIITDPVPRDIHGVHYVAA